MIIYSALFYILLMVTFQNYLGNNTLEYAFFLILSLVLGYFLNRKFENPLTKAEKYLRKEHPTLSEVCLIFLPEILFILLIAIAIFFNI